MSKILPIILFLSLVGLSCKDSTKVTEVIIFGGEYIAGSIKTESGTSKAVCWINEVAVELTNGAQNAYATGVDLKGDELFVCGYEESADLEIDRFYTPVYWRNGVRSVIANQNASTSAIQIQGGDIYVAGTRFEDRKTKTNAVWWKNGQINPLTNGVNRSEATGLFVDSLDVYVVGSEVVSETTMARLWKNGVRVPLEVADGMSEANGVIKHGEDVFVFGSFTPFVFPFSSRAVYWKNGKRIALDLPDGGSSASVTDLTFWGESMYITGYYYSGLKYEACYWENGMFKKMSAESHAEARGISAIRNRIRVIGNLHHGAGVIWDNGVITMQANGARFNKILYK